MSNEKPAVTRNRITDASAAKAAKASICNGQVAVRAVGKEGGLVCPWIMDTGKRGDKQRACLPVYVKLMPTKLEVQDASGSKLTNAKLENGKQMKVCVAGLAGTAKAEYASYTAEVPLKYQSYVTAVPVPGSRNQFMIGQGRFSPCPPAPAVNFLSTAVS